MLVLSPHYIDKDTKRLKTAPVVEELEIQGTDYTLYGITLHTGGDHFIAVLKEGDHWSWYDGLKKKLRRVNDITIPKGHKFEHVVYKKKRQ